MLHLKILVGNQGDVEVLLVFKGQEELGKSQDLYEYLKDKEIFKVDLGEIYSNISPKEDNVIFLGLGDQEKLSLDSLRKAFYKLGKELKKLKIESAKVTVPEFENLCYRRTNMAIAEACLNQNTPLINTFPKRKAKHTVKEFYLEVLEDKKDKVQEGIDEVYNIVEGIFLTRDLVNEPAIVMTPKELANRAKEELEPLGVEVEVFGREKIEELGMEAFWLCQRVLPMNTQFIIMRWNGDKNSNKKIALVGKGLTFDSGGYSLKPAEAWLPCLEIWLGQQLLSAMKAIGKSKLGENVVASGSL